MVNIRKLLTVKNCNASFAVIAILVSKNNLFSQETTLPLDSLASNEEVRSRESKTIIISSKIGIIDVEPTAYRITIYPRSRPAEPFISKLFFPEESIQVMLPIDILSSDSLGNVFKIEPLGSDLVPQYRFFNSENNDISITPFVVSKPSDVLKILVLDKETGGSIASANVSLFQNGSIIDRSITDSLGYIPMRVPKNRDPNSLINMIIDTDQRFPIWQESFPASKGDTEKVIMLSKNILEPGESVYYMIEDHSPFRLGPENGSEVLFFLNRMDEIVISKVAGTRLYGRTRVYLESKGFHKNIFGWVKAEDVSYKQIDLK